MDVKSLNNSTANSLLPERPQFSHKGSFGKVLLICGSKRMVGCCTLATEGALRSGAGLVTLAFPDVLYDSVTSSLRECLFMPLPTDDRGFISHLALSDIMEEAGKSDVVIVGCGIGTGYAQSLIVTTLLSMDKINLILDADALNNLAPCVEILKKAKANVLLTPHPGEMSRLMGLSVDEIENNRQKVIESFSREYNVNVLLKGHETLICNADCTELYINKTGNSGLAKGGAGDLLAGVIAGLTPSLDGDLFKSAVLGAYVHGMSADVLKEDMSEYSILPSDCALALGKVYKILESSDID